MNSHRYTEQDYEEVHPWEGYFCAFGWLCGIPENPQFQPQTPRRTRFPHMYIVKQVKVNPYLRTSCREPMLRLDSVHQVI